MKTSLNIKLHYILLPCSCRCFSTILFFLLVLQKCGPGNSGRNCKRTLDLNLALKNVSRQLVTLMIVMVILKRAGMMRQGWGVHVELSSMRLK